MEVSGKEKAYLINKWLIMVNIIQKGSDEKEGVKVY